MRRIMSLLFAGLLLPATASGQGVGIVANPTTCGSRSRSSTSLPL